jgi:hypothetical protein
MDQWGEELMRMLGRAESSSPKCALCQAATAPFRCSECLHDCDLCRTCMVREHAQRPLHRVKVWLPSYMKHIQLLITSSEVDGHILGSNHASKVGSSDSAWTRCGQTVLSPHGASV